MITTQSVCTVIQKKRGKGKGGREEKRRKGKEGRVRKGGEGRKGIFDVM